MRLKSFLVILMCVLTALFSCARAEVDEKEVLIGICDAIGGGYGKGVLYTSAETELEGHTFLKLTDAEFGFLYNGRKEPPGCFSRIAGYAVRIPSDESGYEIHVVKCRSLSDTDEVKQMLLCRVERLQGAEILKYAPESYEAYFRGAEVFVKGSYVFLLATPDNALARETVKKLL